jgi:hypothetical protein
MIALKTLPPNPPPDPSGQPRLARLCLARPARQARAGPAVRYNQCASFAQADPNKTKQKSLDLLGRILVLFG